MIAYLLLENELLNCPGYLLDRDFQVVPPLHQGEHLSGIGTSKGLSLACPVYTEP